MTNVEKLNEVKKTLRELGIDFLVTRKDDTIACINIWIGED